MKEHMTLFKAEMIRATMEGRKTVTRRVITAHNSTINGYPASRYDWGKLEWDKAFLVSGVIHVPYQLLSHIPQSKRVVSISPKWQVGDVLCVKETWAICSFSLYFKANNQLQVAYKAGVSDIAHPDGMSHDLKWVTVDFGTWRKYTNQKYFSWQSPLFIPRWAIRTKREITKVRAGMIQDITAEEVVKEGIPRAYADMPPGDAEIQEFAKLWDSINEKRGFGWLTDCWVWAYDFKE